MAHDETLQSEAETQKTKDETTSKYPGDKKDQDEKLQSDEQAQDAPVSKPPVPSGHILTKQELQVLAALLAKYSDEKLKQIDLTIQKKKGSDISREEIESSLRKEGLTMIADDLKDNLEKGVENLQHYEEYEKALKEGIELTLAYLKLLFFGPPRSGKSSMRRRLMKEIINLSELSTPSVSTGVAESSDVIIKRITSEQAAIAGSEWWSMKKSNESCKARNLEMFSEEDLSYISHLFCQLIRKQATAPASGRELVKSEQGAKLIESYSGLSDNPTKKEVAEQVDSIPQVNEVEDEHPNSNSPTLSDSEAVEIKKAFEKLSRILQSDSPEEFQKMLTELTLTLVNMMDVGGQPSFLDMLPALTIGSALFMLFFRLDQDFQKHYPVKFHGSDSKAEITLESLYCIEEVLGQCMASIECFAGSSLPEDDNSSSDSQASSRALLFGTFKDQVSEDQIGKIESTLQEKFLGTKMYEEGLLLKSSDGKMFISVDNMHGTDESEMSAIRKDLEEIIKQFFQPVLTPASWFMLRIVLHLLKKPIVSLAECKEIAKQLSMPSPVEEAIWFFQNNGSLMHYSRIPSMQGVIICNPQVIFDSISELIIDKFQYSNRALKPGEVDEFIQKGQFGLSHIKKTKCQRQDLLTPDQLVDVLKYHNIVAEIEQNQGESTSERKFIMPAVLKYASEEELKLHTSDCKQETCSLMIWFQSGFVPFGLFCGGISHLIAHQDSMLPAWKMSDKQVRKNKIQFIIDKSFCTTLISRPQYLEIRVEQCPNANIRYSMADINFIVRQTVVEALETVISKMRNKTHVQTEAPANKLFHFAFPCCLEPSHSDHLMKVDKGGADYSAECLKNSLRVNLNEKHLKWFNQNGGSFMRCPVCHEVQVDPCTLTCGHTTCQLCLAHIWNNGSHSCPVCKTSQHIFPSVSIEYRDQIETLHSELVTQRRQQYTQTDKDLIKSLSAKNKQSLSPSSGEKTAIKQSESKTSSPKAPSTENAGDAVSPQVSSFAGHLSQGLAVITLLLGVVIAFLLFSDPPREKEPPHAVEFIYYGIHSINRSEVTQIIDLTQFGIKLYVPSNTVGPNVTLTVGIGNTGNFIFPENLTLVSSNYYIKASSELMQPMTVEIEHCVDVVDKHQSSKLTFGNADTGNIPPYRYRKVDNGSFTIQKSSGSITISKFSFLAMFWTDSSPPVKYMAGVFIHRHKYAVYQVLLLAGRSLAVNKKIVTEEYSKWTQIVQWFLFEFTDESEKMIINIGKDGHTSGKWTVIPIISPPEIQKSAVDVYFGTCELRAAWMSNEEALKELDFTLEIDGISVNSVKIIIDNEENNKALSPKSPPAVSEGAGDDIENIHDLLQAVKDIGNWKGLCRNLRVSEGIIDSLIHSGNHHETNKEDCLTTYWNSGEATWTRVVRAVAMAPINNKRIAKMIAKKYGVAYDKVINEE